MKRLIIPVISLYCTLSLAQSHLPQLGDPSSATLSIAQENQIGKKYMHTIAQHMPLLRDPLIVNYVKSLGAKLASQSPHQSKQHFHFFVVEAPSINAFAGPGGYIGINTGTMTATENESQLAAVMAHEIGHVTQRHIARGAAEANNLRWPTIGAMLAAIALSQAAGGSQASTGAVMAAMAGNAESQLGFSRDFEREADTTGMDIMYKAGFDPRAMPSFFKLMQRLSLSYQQGIPEYLSSHPLTQSRIAAAENRLKFYHPQNENSSEMYYLMRARTRVDIAKKDYAIINYFTDQVKQHTYENKQAAEYGLSLALINVSHFNAAKKQLNNLISQHPFQVIYPMALANVYFNENKVADAIQLLKNTYDFNSDFYPLFIQYANTLIAANKAQKAMQLIHERLLNDPHNLTWLALLARAQSASNDLTGAYETRAKIFLIAKNKKAAAQQYREALNQPGINKTDKQRIREELNAIM